jgi:hypothetical protein
MGNFAAKNKDYMRTLDPTGKLYDMVSSIEEAVNNVQSQTGAAGTLQKGQSAPVPPKPANISVAAAGGIFQVNIADQTPGVNYVLEYSTTKNFPANPAQIPLALGVKQYRAALGNQTLFWRVRSGFPTAPHSAPLSEPTYHGTAAAPTPVVGGGATIGPPA